MATTLETSYLSFVIQRTQPSTLEVTGPTGLPIVVPLDGVARVTVSYRGLTATAESAIAWGVDR